MPSRYIHLYSSSHVSSTDSPVIYPDSLSAPGSQASFPKTSHNLGALESQVVCTHDTHHQANNAPFPWPLHKLSLRRNLNIVLPNQRLLYFSFFHFPLPLVFSLWHLQFLHTLSIPVVTSFLNQYQFHEPSFLPLICRYPKSPFPTVLSHNSGKNAVIHFLL